MKWIFQKLGHKNEAGFTLAELLVTLCLTALLLSFFLQCFFMATGQNQQQMARQELETNLLLAMETITKDIARSHSVQDCQKEQLTLKQDKMICYSLGEDQQAEEHFYPLEGKILYRRESTQYNRQPMANFISEMEFTYLDPDGLPTEQAENVRAVQVALSVTWNGQQIWQQQIICLAGTDYL